MELKETLIQGYNDYNTKTEVPDWFKSYTHKQAYLLGRSLAMDKLTLTEESALEYANGLGI